jgi:hypothetical protein
MIVIERQIQKVHPGKWEELEEIDKKINAVEIRVGFPPKKRYRHIIGGHDLNTLIIERQWDSLAAMEAAIEKIIAEPGHQALGEKLNSIIKSIQIELYQPWPPE